MDRKNLSPSATGTLYVLAGAIVISFSPMFVRLDDVGPTAVAFYRLLWGAVALFGVAIMRRDRLVPSKSLFLLLTASALFLLSIWPAGISPSSTSVPAWRLSLLEHFTFYFMYSHMI